MEDETEFSMTSEGIYTGEEYLRFKTIIEYFMTP